MSREELKECVKWLRKAVNVADSVVLDKYYLIGSNVKVIVDALEVYEKLLSLPTRTLETMLEGDWVDVKWVDEHYGDSLTIKGTVTEVVKFDDPQFNWFRINSDVEAGIKFVEVTKIEIIPQEVYEILKGVIGNE